MKLAARPLRPALAAIALVVAACSNPAPSAAPTVRPTGTQAPSPTPTASPSSTPVIVIRWWHTTTANPGKSIWDTAARMFMSEHPGVAIDIETMDETTLAKRIAGVEQTGEVPDLLASSAGASLADMANKGLLKDISGSVASWTSPSAGDIAGMNLYAVAGKQVGAPWAMGTTAFLYNKPLFARVGLGVPATWADVLAAVDRFRANGIVPFTIGGRDEWPAMNLWSYLLLREAGRDAYKAMTLGGQWNDQICLKASSDLAALVAKTPFQPGYLNATFDDEAGWMGSGQVALELAGEWAPAAQQANTKDGKGLGDDAGAFPFPTVAGGAGDISDAIGSPSGFAVGKRAPEQAVELLHFLLTRGVQDEIGASGIGLPSVASSIQTIGDPALRQLVQAREGGGTIQLYLNLVLSPEKTKAVEDAVALLLAGRGTPAQTCQSIAAAFGPMPSPS